MGKNVWRQRRSSTSLVPFIFFNKRPVGQHSSPKQNEVKYKLWEHVVKWINNTSIIALFKNISLLNIRTPIAVPSYPMWTNLNLHYLRILPHKVQLFWSISFRENFSRYIYILKFEAPNLSSGMKIFLNELESTLHDDACSRFSGQLGFEKKTIKNLYKYIL